MDWVPIVFVTFKLLVLGTGMFFAIKWQYDMRNKNSKVGESVEFVYTNFFCQKRALPIFGSNSYPWKPKAR